MAVGLLKKCLSCGKRYDSGVYQLYCPHCKSGLTLVPSQLIPWIAELPAPEKDPQAKRPSWDEICMDLADHLSRRSTCARASVGCVIVSEDYSMVLGWGYNGGPKGLNNQCLSPEPGKCGHLHAEINALIKTNFRDAATKKAYITAAPCYACSVALVNADIREVVYRDDYRDHSGIALLADAGIRVRRFPTQGVPERYLQVDEDREP